jgi:hypothetical protein
MQTCDTTIATLQSNNYAILQHNNHATLQRNNNATLQRNNHATAGDVISALDCVSIINKRNQFVAF